MSVPDPLIVNVPFAYDADPATPTAPMSCCVHGAGSVLVGAWPVPDTTTSSGLPGAVLMISMTALSGPVCTGLKYASKPHVAPGDNGDLTHCDVFQGKKLSLSPAVIIRTAWIATGAVPVFVIVTCRGADCVPRVCVPKSRLAGDTEIVSVPGGFKSCANRPRPCVAATSVDPIQNSSSTETFAGPSCGSVQVAPRSWLTKSPTSVPA